MKRNKFTVNGVAMAFALTAGLAVPAVAQENPPTGPGPAGSRSAGSGTATGSAVSRGGGGGEAVSRGGGGVESRGSGSSGGGMSGGSMGSSSSPSMPSSSGFGEAPTRVADRAPRRSDDSGQATRRPSSQGQASGRSAVPRGSGGSSGSSSAGRETASSASAGRSNETGSERRAVPVYSRPRDGRPSSGAAIDRRNLPPGVGAGRDIFYIYRPYYYPYGFWGSSYGFGLGYLYYDPFWYGGYGYGYPGYGHYGGSGYYSGSGGYSQAYRDTGNLRLKIKPREAQVFVDGYFVGVVDSFDGVFQRLNLDGGAHKVELKAEGYEPLEFDVLITPGETVTYKGEMKRIQ